MFQFAALAALLTACLLESSAPTSAAEPKPSNAAKESDADSLAEFRELLTTEWEWTLAESPTLASSLGDLRYNTRWPDLTPAAHERRLQHQRDVLQRLDSWSPAAWPLADQLNYRLFRRQLAQELEESAFRWHLVPLTHRDGIQDENSLADSLPFDRLSDYEDWLTRLRAFPEYMQQTIALMAEGIHSGRVQARVVMQRVPRQIERQIVADPRESLFFKPFRQFPATISTVDQARLQAAAEDAIREHVVPAYRRLLEFFQNDYLPACLERPGLWQLPQGRELYAFRLRQFTTTNLTARDVHELGLSEVRRISQQMDEIRQRVGFTGTLAEFLVAMRTDPKFQCQSEQELMQLYLAFSKRVDPLLTKLFGRLPRIPYGLEAIPTNMAADTTAAYYRPPSADGRRAGTYFVNLYRPAERPRYEIAALTLHEAVPGHHLQIALAMELDNLPEFRRFSQVTAYVEGWALYAESLGDELGLYADPYDKFGQLTYEMWRAVRLVVDTGLHELGWTREEAIAFFREHAAKSELDIANEVDRYISWPGQALAYKVGQLKIRELRTLAEQTLGDRFDLRAFHDEVLRHGAIPLNVLEELIREWIKEPRTK